MDDFERVRLMYDRFGLHRPGGTPHLLDDETAAFRVAALREELGELEQAYQEQDLPAISDALVDIVVFALGTAALHDLPWGELFVEVMDANMRKVPGPGVKARGSGPDLLKPEGWQPPDASAILGAHGWFPEPWEERRKLTGRGGPRFEP